MEKKKTLGVTATAIYGSFSGLILLPIGLLLLIFSETKDGNLYFMLGGLLFSVLGIFLLASVYGLWTLQEWGRRLTIWLSVISIVLGLISVFPIWPNQNITLSNTLLQVIGIAICIVIIRYLSRDHIKVLFE